MWFGVILLSEVKVFVVIGVRWFDGINMFVVNLIFDVFFVVSVIVMKMLL